MLSIWRRSAVGLILACPLLAGCGDNDPSPIPTGPAPITSTPPQQGGRPAPLGNWRADAVLMDARWTDAPCGWETLLPKSRTEIGWQVVIDGGSITLDEDTANAPTDNLPYKGRLDDRQFSAVYTGNGAPLRCLLVGGTLTGTFSADFASFEAIEVLQYGPSDAATLVRWRWTGTRR